MHPIQNTWDLYGYLAECGAVRIADRTTFRRVESDTGVAFFNSVYDLQTAATETVNAVIAAMRMRQQAGRAVMCWVSRDHARWTTALTSHGFVAASPLHVLTARTADAAAGAIDVRPVRTQDDYAQWLTVFQRARNASDQTTAEIGSIFAPGRFAPEERIQHLLAFDDTRPVAGATVYLGSTMAGIYSVGTVPDVRRRGWGSMITRAAMSEAASRGYATVMLEAEDAGALTLYRRLGFTRSAERVIVYHGAPIS